MYEVEHLLTKHTRALKVVHPKQGVKRRYVERLLREASVAGRLKSPYVVETLDAGMLDDGTAYVLMELLEGESLLDVIEKQSPLDVGRTVRIVSQICQGIVVAHDEGIIHRDLKPENIFLVRAENGEENVKILDFGISRFRDLENQSPATRLTAEGSVIGTPFYMSPEQARGALVDERTDVYALGVILYEALTGKLPFVAETTGALFIKIGTGEHLPLRHRRRDLDPALADIVEKAFDKDAAKRFASVEELRLAIEPWIGKASTGPAIRRETAPYESGRPVRSRPRGGTRPGVGGTSDEMSLTVDAEDIAPPAMDGVGRELLVEEPTGARGGTTNQGLRGGITKERERVRRRLRWALPIALAVGFGVGVAVILSQTGGARSHDDVAPEAPRVGVEPRDEAGTNMEPIPEAPLDPPLTVGEGEDTDTSTSGDADETPGSTSMRPHHPRSNHDPDEPPNMRRSPAEEAGLEMNPYSR